MVERNLNPVSEIFTPIAALLETATTVKSYFAERSSNRAPKRWDWEPTGGAVEGASRATDLPRSLHDVRFGVDIYCRAKTFDEAWTMLEQLVTALIDKNAHAYEIGSWRWLAESGEASTLKHAIILSVEFVLPVFEQMLSAGATDYATVTTVTFDTSSAVDPDGTLHTPKN
jgi:hypothetical protein